MLHIIFKGFKHAEYEFESTFPFKIDLLELHLISQERLEVVDELNSKVYHFTYHFQGFHTR